MRFKNDNDNRYRVNFTRATEAHIDKMTVAEFIEYLENNAELEDESTPIYIDGKTIWCKDYVLRETYKLRKEFLVSEDGGRLFYSISVIKRAELVDDSTEAAADNTEAINRKERRTMASEERRTKSTEELINTLNDFCSQILITAEAKGLTRKEVKRVPSWLDSMLTSESFNDEPYTYGRNPQQ